MIKVNQDNLTSQAWSLRDISKIFARMKNQKSFHEYFRNVGTAINLLFYAMSSIPKDQINEDNVDQLIKALKEIFGERIQEEDLQKVFKDEAKLYDEFDSKNQIRKYYIQKHNSYIFIDKINEGNKRNEEEKKRHRKKLEKYAQLPNF